MRDSRTICLSNWCFFFVAMSVSVVTVCVCPQMLRGLTFAPHSHSMLVFRYSPLPMLPHMKGVFPHSPHVMGCPSHFWGRRVSFSMYFIIVPYSVWFLCFSMRARRLRTVNMDTSNMHAAMRCELVLFMMSMSGFSGISRAPANSSAKNSQRS